MTQTTALALLTVAALLLANVPWWFAARVHRNLPTEQQLRWSKTALFLLTMLFAYGLFLAAAWMFEGLLGQRKPQGWAFYAVTGCMFVTFAFPSFVYGFLLKRQPVQTPTFCPVQTPKR